MLSVDYIIFYGTTLPQRKSSPKPEEVTSNPKDNALSADSKINVFFILFIIYTNEFNDTIFPRVIIP
ncbi:MAG: hypothetical protein EU549_03235 [Promethearchaeota archaeon]|nr:MAG: hypothetical protein EU549_03235 [Candidatus Lokiarchaeota archaeon]